MANKCPATSPPPFMPLDWTSAQTDIYIYYTSACALPFVLRLFALIIYIYCQVKIVLEMYREKDRNRNRNRKSFCVCVFPAIVWGIFCIVFFLFENNMQVSNILYIYRLFYWHYRVSFERNLNC